MSDKRTYQRGLNWLLLPYKIGIFALFVLPASLTLGLAFFRYDGLTPPKWSGDLSFLLAFTDELFLLSIANSLAFVLLPVPLRVLGAFFAARLLQHGGRGLQWLRAIVYLPSIIPSAAYALAWVWILNPLFGPLNALLRAIGLMPPNWLADSAWSRPGIALALLWTIGEGFLVCLAALNDIPAHIEEAAQVDGASKRQIWLHILLPLMTPILLILAFRDTALLMQESFTTVVLMTNGGPYYSTYTLPLFIYETGFDLLQFGTASALIWVLYALTGLVVAALYTVARGWGVGATDEQFFL